jgi:hypothetical protein
MKTYIVTTEFVRSSNGPCRTEEDSHYEHSFDDESEARKFYEDVCSSPEPGIYSVSLEYVDCSEAKTQATKRFNP